MKAVDSFPVEIYTHIIANIQDSPIRPSPFWLSGIPPNKDCISQLQLPRCGYVTTF